ncbi:hypothetical protein AB0M46_00195 [Dactylosporangium sp. NPDC051485]|uniref:hypothetical protein n=1 Tax=Dactylosporangium sp. NPDC051485 TaxID=3154846 RepID=UPI003430342D
MVAAISVTMQYAVPIEALSAGSDQTPDGERQIAREVADAIGDGRVAAALLGVLPGADTALSVRIIAGHTTLIPAPAPAGRGPLGTADEEHTVPSTVLLLPISRTDPTSVQLMAAHQPRQPDWCCATCATPWPCPVQQASLTANIYAGNGRGVGLTLTSNVACAFLDQPRACPGCLTRQFFGWMDDDLYARMVADPTTPVPATGGDNATHGAAAAHAPNDDPRARPRSRTFTPAHHLADCSNEAPAADRLGSPSSATPTGMVCAHDHR